MTRRPGRRRPGVTLLEVIVSTVIFMLSATAIYYMIGLGGERTLDVYDGTKASLLCQSKMAEVIAGAEPLGNGGGGYSPVPDDSNYEYRVEASESDVPNLWDVKVSVRRERSPGNAIEVQLCQKVLDPASRGSTFDQPATEPAPSSSSGTTDAGMAATPTTGGS